MRECLLSRIAALFMWYNSRNTRWAGISDVITIILLFPRLWGESVLNRWNTCRQVRYYYTTICHLSSTMRYKGIKAKCWKEVKRIVRERESDCYTCNAKDLEGANAQAGHYQPVAIVGSNNNLAWDIDFIHLQCGRCNGVGQGMQVEYRKRLVEELGEEKVAEYDRQVRGKFVNPVESWELLLEKLKCTSKTK